MSLENVLEFFKEYGKEDDVMIYDQSSATVELAAKAVGTEPERIAKTLSYKLKDGSPILVVAAGDARVSNKLFKETFSCKAKMLSREEVNELIGHEVGGVCPFAIKDGVNVYLDRSLLRFDTVFPACGSSNSAIELTIDELEKYSHFTNWVEVCTYL